MASFNAYDQPRGRPPAGSHERFGVSEFTCKTFASASPEVTGG